MSSNAYIASDGMNRMKVGKTNDPKRREKQIALPITVTIQCLDETAALRIETQLRQFVIQRGGIRHQQTIDWFIFDPQIYEMLCQFASGLIGQSAHLRYVETEDNIDLEIAAVRKRYYQLLLAEIELNREAQARVWSATWRSSGWSRWKQRSKACRHRTANFRNDCCTNGC